MEETTLKTKASSNPRAAATDAAARNSKNKSLYSSSQRATAQTYRDLLDSAYGYDEIFINYRQRFIAIKLTNPAVSNNSLAAKVDALLAERGVTRAVTEQGTVYRIPNK